MLKIIAIIVGIGIIAIIGFIILCIIMAIIDKKLEEDEKEEEGEYQPQILSPLEEELKKIKPYSPYKIKTIVKYIVSMYQYQYPYVEMGSSQSPTDLFTIVSEYSDNQLFFSKNYGNHVIDFEGEVQTVGKDNNGVYIVFDDDRYYQHVKRRIKCYLNQGDMENEEYKNLILNVRTGTNVTLVGILVDNYDGIEFIMCQTVLIAIDGRVPNIIMNVVTNAIYKKYGTKDKKNE